MNGEMFLDLRRADLQDLFPSAEEFSVRKKIFDFLGDVVSKIAQHEIYIMILGGLLIKIFLSLAFNQKFTTNAEEEFFIRTVKL